MPTGTTPSLGRPSRKPSEALQKIDLILRSHFLRPFGMELAVEDHDLHHRFGRSGTNFGKQTRVWDKIFGQSNRPHLTETKH